jgi:hypothetical protein
MAKRGRKRRAWTAEHVRKLKRLALKRMPAANIARTLNRTEGATRQKACSLGLSLETRAGNPIPKTGAALPDSLRDQLGRTL